MSETLSSGDVPVDINERRFTLPDTAFLARVPDKSLRNWMARSIITIGDKHWPSGRWYFSVIDALRLKTMHSLCVRPGLDFGPTKAAIIAELVVNAARDNLAAPSDGYRHDLNVVIAWELDGEMFGTTANIREAGRYHPQPPATDDGYEPLRNTVVCIPAAAMLRDLIIRIELLAQRNRKAEAPTHV
jgi:hypothetical protein